MYIRGLRGIGRGSSDCVEDSYPQAITVHFSEITYSRIPAVFANSLLYL